MRIFAKKAFKFEQDGQSCQVRPLAFADIDEKFSKCLLFKLGQQDGDIEIIDSAAKQKKLEAEPGAASRGGKKKDKSTKPEGGEGDKQPESEQKPAEPEQEEQEDQPESPGDAQ